MSSRVAIWSVAVVLMLLPLSCEKLPQSVGPGEGKIAMEALPEKDSIPSNWGNLISVTNFEEWGPVFQLWFQDEDGTVRMVAYNMRTNQLVPNSKLIPRK